MIKRIYVAYIANKFLNKIFLTYFTILILALSGLALTVSNNINSTLQTNQADYNRTILYILNHYFDEKYETALNISSIIYHDGYSTSNGSNVINFLENQDSELSTSYLDLKTNFYRYFDEMFSRDNDIFNILVYHKLAKELYLFTKNSRIQEDIHDFQYPDRIKQSDKPYANMSIFPTIDPIYAKGERVYTLASPIKALTKLSENVGVLAIDYKVASIDDALAHFTQNFKGSILVLTQSGETIYDSSARYYTAKFPYLQALKTAQSTSEIDGEASLITTTSDNKLGLLIVTIVPNSEILASVDKTNRTIYLITFICIIAGLLLTLTSTLIFSKRIKTITGFMQKLRLGNLSEKIPNITSYDEIGQIALSFNKMTNDLQNNINRVYLSEIKQKNAELTALQAQINPHFLYNTLEVIRMKADLSGDNEVGDMIYILSQLFRNTIKQEHLIIVEDEIKNANLYLELFRIRYGDKLHVKIEVADEILQYGIIKHTLQPIIENYIVHGFDKDRTNNSIIIQGVLKDKFLYLTITDNGIGIPEEKLLSIREILLTFKLNSDNIGITNVNERIKLIYGHHCGLEIDSLVGHGTTVTIKLEAKSKKELEDVQGFNS